MGTAEGSGLGIGAYLLDSLITSTGTTDFEVRKGLTC